MSDAVQPFDWGRMLVGDQDALFFLEIVFRTLVLYAYGFALMRWLGSRTIGQLSTIEFLLVIALGSALGDPMFYPEVPLLHAMAVITIVVVANKLLDLMVARSRRAERIIDGRPAVLIRNGVFIGSGERAALGRSEIFQQLRQHNVRQLGEVEFAYLEPSGLLSVFKRDEPQPGLPIVPPWQIVHPNVIAAGTVLNRGGAHACLRCGWVEHIAAGETAGSCRHCGHEHWTPAAGEHGAVQVAGGSIG